MNIKVCDRCGKKIINFPQQQTISSIYEIKKLDALCRYIEIDLCSECSIKFSQWLKEKEQQEGECGDS